MCPSELGWDGWGRRPGLATRAQPAHASLTHGFCFGRFGLLILHIYSSHYARSIAPWADHTRTRVNSFFALLTFIVLFYFPRIFMEVFLFFTFQYSLLFAVFGHSIDPLSIG